LIRERLVTLRDAVDLVGFVFAEKLDYDPQLLVQKGMTAEQARQMLAESRQILSAVADFDEATLEPPLRAKADTLGLKPRQFFGTLRIATTGREVSPPLFGTLAILGRDRVLARIARAQEMLAALADPAEAGRGTSPHSGGSSGAGQSTSLPSLVD
jgi:glutamyl-tRNA synthetase